MAAIRRIARQCKAKEHQVLPTLSAEARIKSMKKMQQDFESEALVGPYEDRQALRLAMLDAIRANPGCESFYFSDEDMIVSTQFSVEESHAYAESEIFEEGHRESNGGGEGGRFYKAGAKQAFFFKLGTPNK